MYFMTSLQKKSIQILLRHRLEIFHLNFFAFRCHRIVLFRGGGTGGARGAAAPPIFGGQRNKIHVEFCLLSWLISVVHPLFSSPRAAPVNRMFSKLIDFVLVNGKKI